jgi:hypothetical protein
MGHSTLVQTALSVVDGYNTWTMEAILAPRASNCVQHILPGSLGQAPMNNQEYRAYFGQMLHGFKNFHVTVIDIFEDAPNNKVALHISSTADSLVGPYRNEYMFLMYMTPDHKKVEKLMEFVDSNASIKQINKLTALSEEQKKKGKL